MKEKPTIFAKIIIRLPALLIVGGIWFFSSKSTIYKPKGIFGYDKIQHFIAYFLLAIGGGLWISSAFWRRQRFLAFFLVTLTVSVYGIIDEVHQFFTPGRDCNLADWIADTIGAVFGAALMMRVDGCCSDKTENDARKSML
ncbi:MAG: VanZ family protein [Treponema sp.]|jgi:VanZ family protein|nr:VanZ family protein [Treponema sp.]